jgi:hypothetical protein
LTNSFFLANRSSTIALKSKVDLIFF